MVRMAVMLAAAFAAVTFAGGADAGVRKPKRFGGDQVPRTLAMYGGDLAPTGAYAGLGSGELFDGKAGFDLSGLSGLVDEERRWMESLREAKAAHAEARAKADRDFQACREAFSSAYRDASKADRRKMKQCRRVSVPFPKAAPEPAASMPLADHLSDGLTRAWVRHMANPVRPAGRDAKVAESAATPGEEDRLRLADSFVNSMCPYYRRLVDPKGWTDDPSKDTEWISEFTQTPTVATSNGGCDCRDYASSKVLMLAEAGFPVERLGLAVILPAAGNGPEAGGTGGAVDILHVVTAVRTGRGTGVLDQVRRDGGETVFPLASKRWSIASRGVLWAGGMGGSRFFRPVGSLPVQFAARPESLPIADDEGR